MVDHHKQPSELDWNFIYVAYEVITQLVSFLVPPAIVYLYCQPSELKITYMYVPIASNRLYMSFEVKQGNTEVNTNVFVMDKLIVGRQA